MEDCVNSVFLVETDPDSLIRVAHLLNPFEFEITHPCFAPSVVANEPDSAVCRNVPPTRSELDADLAAFMVSRKGPHSEMRLFTHIHRFSWYGAPVYARTKA